MEAGAMLLPSFFMLVPRFALQGHASSWFLLIYTQCADVWEGMRAAWQSSFSTCLPLPTPSLLVEVSSSSAKSGNHV